MKPKIGDKVIIIKNSRPESRLWNRKGEMNPTINQMGVIIDVHVRSDDSDDDSTYRISFSDASINNQDNQGWMYWESDFELIPFSETTINY